MIIKNCAVFLMTVALCSSLHAKGIDTSLQETLELKKITEYWMEKEYAVVKVRIEDFLDKNPSTPHANQLYAMLGDLLFLEKNYTDAIAAYDHIEEKALQSKCQFQRLHSLYETGKYEEFIHSSDAFLHASTAKEEQIHTVRFELAECYFHLGRNSEEGLKKKDLLKEALYQYHQVMQTKYGAMTLEAQAEIHTALEEYPKAASLYLQLASQHPTRRENYLFQAAALQVHFNKNAAIDTFGTIAQLGEDNASKAAINQLNLLFQEERYKDFILLHAKALTLIPTEHAPLIHYYLGKSLVHIHDYSTAVEPLLQAASSKKLDRAQEKSALVSLIVCAKETQNLPLLETTLSLFKSAFAGDEEKGGALLLYSQLCTEKKEWTKAREALCEILENAPDHPQREALLYDIALLYSREQLLQEGAHAFADFLEQFPKSAQRQSALRHLVSLRLEDVKGADLPVGKIKKEYLIDALAMALEENKSFSPSEKQKMRYLLGKMQFEMGHYEEAIEQLTEYTQDYRSDPSCTEAYLLLAYCYKREDGDEIHFVLNAEKALAQNPEIQGALDLHVALYNAYLTLATEAAPEEKPSLIAKAADHLFFALDKPIHKDNQRWLAGYYFHQHQNGQVEARERSTLILEKLIGVPAESGVFSSPMRDVEGEALKLAALYKGAGQHRKCAQLLEALNGEQTSHPNFEWKYSRMTEFELAKAWESLGEKEKALATYNHLITSSSHISSYFSIAAQLEEAKLIFSMLSPNERQENSASVIALCDTLKNVHIQRKLHSEPLHLEAALCYIDIKTELAPAEEQCSRRQSLLEQMRKNFSSMQDPIVQEYLNAASQFPEKERLFWHYMHYIDAEIIGLNAQIHRNPSQKREALGQLSQLLTQSIDPRLEERINKSKEAL